MGDWAVWLEWGALLGAVAVAWFASGPLARLVRRMSGAFEQLHERPQSVVALAFVLGALGPFLFASAASWPVPRVHDEYSYLLAADTFASGQLCEPSPPCAEQLEAFHVVTRPVYASKYPSGQGLALALGQVLFGEPIYGVWLTSGLLCGAMAWLLLALFPPRWALVGLCVVFAKFALTTYWAQSFWGGSLTAAGAALAFAALVRIFERGSFTLGVLLGVGVALLALTRPFEGVLAALPLAAALGVWSVRRLRAGAGRELASTLVGAAVPLVACALWIAALNRAVTGDPLRMPYFLHDAQYAVAPPFLWQEAAPRPHYATVEIERFWTGFAYDLWAEQQNWAGFLQRARIKLGTWWGFFVGAPLALAVVLAPFALRRRWIAFSALGFACVASGVLVVAYDLAHYLAPAAPWIVVLTVAGLRESSRWRVLRTSRRGRALLAAVVALLAAECAVRGYKHVRPETAFEQRRARLEQELAQGERKVLVVVRYSADHSVHEDWVYNRARPAEQRVLWARDHGEAARERLRVCYPGRAGFLLEIGPQGASSLTPLWP